MRYRWPLSHICAYAHRYRDFNPNRRHRGVFGSLQDVEYQS